MRAFLPDETRITRVHLRTGNLERALEFYTDCLGFRLVKKAGVEAGPGRTEKDEEQEQEVDAALGTTESGPPLILLKEDTGAEPRPARATGLYHFAIRYPTRRDLANALGRLLKYPIEGASDHLVSEAIYLSDPDGNGVELYTDRPRSQWTWRAGEVAMTTEPLDLESLLATTEGQRPPPHVPPQADLGHIHLHVADLAAAERFYRDFLGLAVTQRSYPGALFLSAGGYHHHVAVNTWAGDRPPPARSVGLISYRLEVPEAEILYCLEHRAPLAGYEARTVREEDGSELLQIRDLNGNWLEVQHVQSPQMKQRIKKRLQPVISNQ
jgi:catechol 2,3-dioxygenase